MMTTRRRYSADFNAKVALEAIRGDLTLAKVPAKHGVHHTMIASWKRQAIATMPELGSLDNKQAALLAGLAPIARQSGQWKGKSFIRGGGANVRQPSTCQRSSPPASIQT